MSSTFFRPGEDVCPAYRNIRDLAKEPATRGRAFVEELWERYRGMEDPHFLEDARKHFQERFWEMYLTVTLLDRGIDPKKAGCVGPEFWFDHRGTKAWVEAVAPGAGAGNDRVEEPQLGVASYVPAEKILLRFTNAIDAKRERYFAALRKDLISEDDCYVLAINSRLIPHAPYGNTMPFFLQALLPIGNPTLVIERNTGRAVDSYYARRETITKAGGAAVATKAFLVPEYAFVSAVLHSGVDCVNRPEQLGADFTVLHNPCARRPIDHSLFGWCRQYVWADDELQIVGA